MYANTHMAVYRLKKWTAWLEANNVKGYLGEIGWPDNTNGDNAQYNELAERYYLECDRAGLWVTPWSMGEWWGSTYRLQFYEATTASSGVWFTNPQSTVLEAHLQPAGDPPAYYRGINVDGAEFGNPGYGATTSPTFGAPNNVGVYDTNYHWDQQATFDYAYSRGVRFIRLGFRWERLQRNLGGAFDSAEQTRMVNCVNRAITAGLKVSLGVLNFGKYFLWNGTSGVGHLIGSASVTQAHYNDFLTRMSNLWQNTAGVVSYDIMGEPNGWPGTELQQAQAWEPIAQSGLNAIRTAEGAGTHKTVIIPMYGNFDRVTVNHPTSWITDSANKFVYTCHDYWDLSNSGEYLTRFWNDNESREDQGFGPVRNSLGLKHRVGTAPLPALRGRKYIANFTRTKGADLTGTGTIAQIPEGIRWTVTNGSALRNIPLRAYNFKAEYMMRYSDITDGQFTFQFRLNPTTGHYWYVKHSIDGALTLFRYNGSYTAFSPSIYFADREQWNQIGIEAQGNTITLKQQGRVVCTVTDSFNNTADAMRYTILRNTGTCTADLQYLVIES